jgi:hypothetical protein
MRLLAYVVVIGNMLFIVDLMEGLTITHIIPITFVPRLIHMVILGIAAINIVCALILIFDIV